VLGALRTANPSAGTGASLCRAGYSGAGYSGVGYSSAGYSSAGYSGAGYSGAGCLGIRTRRIKPSGLIDLAQVLGQGPEHEVQDDSHPEHDKEAEGARLIPGARRLGCRRREF
jgi:hypothetical protein